MPEETKRNLEPIEEGDLNLKGKFLGGNGAEKEKDAVSPDDIAKKIEAVSAPEQQVERKEGYVEKEQAYTKILSKVPTHTPIRHDEIKNDAASIDQEADMEAKVNKLVNIAETKGIAHAVKVARHYQDNYLLDELHDKLLGEELHDALVKKGMIREI